MVAAHPKTRLLLFLHSMPGFLNTLQKIDLNLEPSFPKVKVMKNMSAYARVKCMNLLENASEAIDDCKLKECCTNCVKAPLIFIKY